MVNIAVMTETQSVEMVAQALVLLNLDIHALEVPSQLQILAYLLVVIDTLLELKPVMTATLSAVMGKLKIFNKLYNYRCSSTCTKESGFSCTSSVPNVCSETCGDGRNYGFYDCDDGNNVNGDGCSSSCQEEDSWYCQGGSSIARDYCYEASIGT